MVTINHGEQPTSKEEILEAFKAILKRHDADEQVRTKAEAAIREEDREVVERVAEYTVEGIVKGMAQMQLDFTGALDGLADMLVGESTRLDELRRSIRVERGRLSELGDTKVAAEALALLEREQAERREEFEATAREALDELEAEIAATRTRWAEEQAEHERALEEYAARLTTGRERAEADYAYEVARERKLAGDKLDARRRELERELDELLEDLEKNWARREAELEAKADEIAALEARAAAFPQELEDATKKARETAIRKTNQEADVDAELTAKQLAADAEVFALQIQELEQLITDQRERIHELNSQLQSASSKAQNLALRAIEGSSSPRPNA